jgi:hypothetical protein
MPIGPAVEAAADELAMGLDWNKDQWNKDQGSVVREVSVAAATGGFGRRL